MLLRARELSVIFPHSGVRAVDRASLELERGDVLGLVGESGSGKTLLARSVLRLLPEGASCVAGELSFEGRDILSLGEQNMRRIRGPGIGMIFQEPMVALNPSMTIGAQMAEGLRLHGGVSAREGRSLCSDMLGRVGIGDPQDALSKYAHEFSGGMRQRVLIASVLLLRPKLVIADEPTTALDAVLQRQILELLYNLTQELGSALILVSHDLAVVSSYADRICVMKDGRVREYGDAEAVLSSPADSYTKRLLHAAFVGRAGASATRQQAGPERLVVIEDLTVEFAAKRSWFSATTPTVALAGLDLSVRRGEIIGVIGQSGSGKSTLGKALLGLCPVTSGAIRYKGLDIGRSTGREKRHCRQGFSLVFQDPYSSLDPRMTIGQAVEEALYFRPDIPSARRKTLAERALCDVNLTSDITDRFPHELSGGQRQRACIARAIVSRPDIIVADEAISALDVTLQRNIVELFRGLHDDYGFACLFVSHDLAIVEHLCHRVVVMYCGRIVESAPSTDILERPAHPYTRLLIRSSYKLRRAATGSLTPVGNAYDLDLAERLLRTMPKRGERDLIEVRPGHFVEPVAAKLKRVESGTRHAGSE